MTPMSATKPPTTCLELAQEGERLCRDNNFDKGILYLRKALEVGTEDTTMLSAIYSQLGNAYYTKGMYPQALEFHRNDLLLTRFTHDELGELKASANVGHTYKAIGAYPDALLYTRHQLKLASKLPEGKERMACEARALYNLATIFQMKSRSAQKSVCLASPPPTIGAEAGEAEAAAAAASGSEEGEQPSYLADLHEAIENFKASLKLSERLPDTLACGRTYGCLGNAYYMLREFRTAIDWHFKRLETARQFGDKGAMRRAYTSLANAHVFLPHMEKAMEFYRLALALAVEMKDEAGEAQSCFALGNAASLVSDYKTAFEYHDRHMRIARRLDDRAGEARAYSSIAADLRALGEHPQAVYFLALRRRMAKEHDDDAMVAATNEQLRAVIVEAGEETMVDERGEVVIDPSLLPEADTPPVRLSRSLRSLHSLDADCGLSRALLLSASDGELARTAREEKEQQDAEDFFDMISRVQGKRYDEQRCDPVVFSDRTNQRTRQTDQMMLSPSVSVSSIHSRRRLSAVFGRLPSYASKKLLHRGSKTPSTSSLGSSKTKRKAGGGAGLAGGEGGDEVENGGFKTPSLSSLRSTSPGRGGVMNGSGVTPSVAARLQSSQQQRRADSTSVLDQSTITTISEDGERCAIPSPSHSSSTGGSRSFVSLHGFKMPSFASSRSRSSKKLSTSASLPEGPSGNEEKRRHSLYARPGELQGAAGAGAAGTNGPEAIMDMIMAMQGRRMEEQRAPLLPGCHDQRILQKIANEPDCVKEGDKDAAEIDDHLYELVLNAQRGRIDDQRSELGGRRASESAAQDMARRPMTIPEDDISELVARMQAGRMDEQRAELPPSPSAASAATTPAAAQ
ncbi:hypothetical protein PMAYCL1PPCAC_03290 [Pristionchus mayeri]|uniref:Uncharacterized protein n=1 Tax=Pristionchus mayeri TaxID=1317129 RepID=A0AAN5C729_9BILA|nr:hypothetical protein PMAYCL1PPCAC_03290 [Pristionchus mayeri]